MLDSRLSGLELPYLVLLVDSENETVRFHYTKRSPSTTTSSPAASRTSSRADSARLELRLRLQLDARWRDGSVAVEFDPIDFVGKLAALVPRPHSNLVRYHGCLAPHASLRAYVVKDGRGPPPMRAARLDPIEALRHE